MDANKPPARRSSAKARKLSAKARTRSRLTALASHAMMGVALGLAFAFIATRSALFGVTPVLAKMTTPTFGMIDFALTCALAFGVVTTITGLAIDLGGDQ